MIDEVQNLFLFRGYILPGFPYIFNSKVDLITITLQLQFGEEISVVCMIISIGISLVVI